MTSTALFRTQAEIARRRFERSGPISVDMSFGTISLRLTGVGGAASGRALQLGSDL